VGEIVVGVDGSPGSLVALRFALAEARLRDATVGAVHAWVFPLVEAPEPFLLEYPGPQVDTLAQVTAVLALQSEERLDRVLQEVAPEAEGVEVERRVTEGNAAAVLMEASKDADLLVVGSRGLGGFSRLLLGSVSRQCVSHASCPVVVVPSPHDG
jgi:nucleotide-binding universal stress UspA family protein